MGRPPKFCASCQVTASQERNKRKRRRKEGQEVQLIELSPGAEKSFLTAFSQLPVVAQRALTYWIEHVMQPARSVGPRGSRHLRRDFVTEAIQVSEEAFKGAMLTCGYRPVNGDQDNWQFLVQKKYPDQNARYGMREHDPVFSRLIDAVDAYYETASLRASQN